MLPKTLLFLLLWSGLFYHGVLKAQPTHSNRALLEQLGDLTSNFYLSSEKGKFLQKKLLEHIFDWELLPPEVLADSVTALLKIHTQDQHFNLLYWEEEEPASLEELYVDYNYGFQQVACLPGNIGYLNYTQFADSKASQKVLAAAFDFLSSTDALIVDVRENPGGDRDILLLLCSYFYKKPTLLSTTSYPQEHYTEKSRTKAKVKGKKYLDKPVYILTSQSSQSAAEALAYHLQQSGRGIVVGERTNGAANPVEIFVLRNNFLFFVPVGQEKSAFTGTNWEKIGVIPNLSTPASGALLKAQIAILQDWLQGKIPAGQSQESIKKQLAVLQQQLQEQYNIDKDDF